jgi:hypothetical protein
VARANYTTQSSTSQSDDNQMDNQFQELWKSFMAKIQEAVEYINIQSPNILDQLNQLYIVISYLIFDLIEHEKII